MKDRPHHLRLVIGCAPAPLRQPAKLHPPSESVDLRSVRKVILLAMMRPAAMEVLENVIDGMLADAGGAA